MKKHQLRALVAVAEHGSIRAAAKSLALSQTALTKALHEFELDLQATLLLRSPQGVRLTPVGAELLRHAKLILTEMEDARAAIRSFLGQGTPRVTAAVTPAVSALCLPETLERFRGRFPDATLSIRDAFLSQTLPMLRDGTVDLAITALNPEVLGTDLSFEPLGRLAIAIAGRPGRFPPVRRRLDSLGDATWLLDGSRGGISEAVRQWLARHEVPALRHVIECPSSMASMILSTQGDSIVPLPRAMLSIPWLGAISQEILLDASPLSVPLGIVIRKDSRLDAPASWFIESVRLALRSVPIDA
ncbi:LysR family transcriptional regulator [Variovorax sp. M-6]|uniref:LysR family transcriptional regulator n=1 Tax=Variovorax sp. M-6 TaxID=3233041 RepID=UPI003F9C9F21